MEATKLKLYGLLDSILVYIYALSDSQLISNKNMMI